MTISSTATGERLSNEANLIMATIPIQLKYHLGKFVYLNGGLLLNIAANERIINPVDKEDKNNIALLLGFGLGIGFKHEFSSGITLSLNPYTRFNGIGKAASLQSEPHQHYKYIQGGVSLGVGYKL